MEENNGNSKYIAEKIEIWKKTVDVQMHFSESKLTIRKYAVSILVALVGGSGYLLKEQVYLTVSGTNIPLAFFVLLFGLISWISFFFLDYYAYHQHLIGAVKHGLNIESELKATFPSIGLAEEIKKASSVSIVKIKFDSSRKIKVFYFSIGLFLILSMILIFISKPKILGSPGKKRSLSSKVEQFPDNNKSKIIGQSEVDSQRLEKISE